MHKQITQPRHKVLVGDWRCQFCGVHLKKRDPYCQTCWPIAINTHKMYNALVEIANGGFGPTVTTFADKVLTDVKEDKRGHGGNRL